MVLGVIDSILFDTGSIKTTSNETGASVSAESNGPLAALFGLATLIPTLAAGWRRMHDTGRSGLYLFYPLIVMVGLGTFASLLGLTIDNAVNGELNGLLALIFGVGVVVLMISPLIVIFWLTRPSQRGTNGYGPHPKTPEARQ